MIEKLLMFERRALQMDYSMPILSGASCVI